MFDNNPDFLLNLEVANGLNNGDSATVSVEICVIHNGVEYVITRSQQYMCSNKKVSGAQKSQVKVSYKQPDGQTESVRAIEVKNVIENILPKDLSTYFFFDTERVRSISTRKDVSDAVKGLLGLSIMDSAIKHIGTKGNKKTVLGKLYGAMDIDGDKRARDALDMIQSSEAKREAIKEQLETCASQIKQYEVRKGQLDDILRDNQTTATLQKKKEDLERRLSAERSSLESTMGLFFKEFSKGSLQMFAQPLLGRAKDFLAATKIDDKGIRDLTAPTIRELIKRGRCICGAEICDGNDAYNYYSEERIYDGFISLVNKLRFSEDNILGQVISRLEMTLAAMKRNNLAARDLSKSIAELNAKLLMLEQLRSKGYLAPEVYQAQANEIGAELAKLKDVRQEKFNSKAAIMLEEVKKLKMLIFELEEPLEAFDEKLFLEIVKSIQINKEDEMSVELLGGLRFRERI